MDLQKSKHQLGYETSNQPCRISLYMVYRYWKNITLKMYSNIFISLFFTMFIENFYRINNPEISNLAHLVKLINKKKTNSTIYKVKKWPL